MSKLTTQLRDAIARAIMSQVDDSESEKLQETIKEKVQSLYLQHTPAEVEVLWKKHRWALMTASHFIGRVAGHHFHSIHNVAVPPTCLPHEQRRQLSDEVSAAIQADLQRLAELVTARQEIEQRIEAALKGCATIKQLKERYPEWVKHLPAELLHTAEKSGALVDTSLITDLTKMGWPKGKKPEDEPILVADSASPVDPVDPKSSRWIFPLLPESGAKGGQEAAA